jgi:hypothetical protein
MRGHGLAASRVLLSVLVAACGTVQSDAKRDETRGDQTQVEERLEPHERLTLTIRTPDGRTLNVDVSPSEFEKAGFLAAGRDVCTPPHEKISDKCVKCANGNVACRD